VLQFLSREKNMNKCPFFNICGGCEYDFNTDDYRKNKILLLPKIGFTDEAIWGVPGHRRRAEFAFNENKFGFFKKLSKDIVNLDSCCNLLPEINEVLLHVANLPWNGSGSVLITACINGICVSVNSNLPVYSGDFKKAVEKLPAQIISFVWNSKIVRQYAVPKVKFEDKEIEYPVNAFLQPSVQTEKILRDLVVQHTKKAQRVVDLFCGLGNFTFITNATGFDIAGTGIQRDLFKKPILAQKLNVYDVVIMDPPRAGALAQIKELAKSSVKKIIYISCNPNSFIRDMDILVKSGYKYTTLIPVDQFVGSVHWEIFSVFEK